MTFEYWLFLSSGLIFIAALRVFHTNRKTLDQRSQLLLQASTVGELEVISAVSYEKHLLYLFFFLDPRRLYPDSNSFDFRR